MTLDEFLTWDPDERSGRRWQLVDGEPLAMAPASENHGAIQSELARLLGNHLLERNRACRVIIEPGVVPRLRAGENWRIPDLGVTCAPAQGGVAMADPVLLVEILSPNNHAETRANIWSYTTLPSLREILVLNAARIEAEVLRRGDDGNWPEQPLVLRDGDMLHLSGLDFSAKLRALYRMTSLAT